jgi:hypothetical protein
MQLVLNKYVQGNEYAPRASVRRNELRQEDIGMFGADNSSEPIDIAAVRKEIEAGYELTKWRSREMDPLLVFISALEVIIALQDQMEMVTKKDLLWFVMLFCIRVTPRTVLKNGVHSAMTKHFVACHRKDRMSSDHTKMVET